jgi:hypothetical protein
MQLIFFPSMLAVPKGFGIWKSTPSKLTNPVKVPNQSRPSFVTVIELITLAGRPLSCVHVRKLY